MRTKRVVLVRGRELGWGRVAATVRGMPAVEVIEAAAGSGAGCVAEVVARRRPDAVVSAAAVGGIAMRPLLLGLRRDVCPELVVVLFGDEPGEPGASDGAAGFVQAHLIWSEVTEETLEPVLACALSGEFFLASPSRVAAFVRERPYAGPGPGVAPPPVLTARESAVLRGLAAGRTRKAIAAEAGLSLRTVGRLLDGLEARLGATSSCELVWKATTLGLLDGVDGGAAGTGG